MLLKFFEAVRASGVSCTPRELLDLVGVLKQGAAFADSEAFYFLSRCCLVKDEGSFDRFDRAFDGFFRGISRADPEDFSAAIPDEWLRQALAEEMRDPDGKALSFDKLEDLLDELKKRLEEQEGRHVGGSHWIGSGGSSPFGHSGENPGGIRIGGSGGKNQARWRMQQPNYRGLDSSEQLGTRNMQMALRRLRRFTRIGREEELDLPATIAATARNGGMLDIRIAPKRKNNVRVLLLLDVGGSMDPYIELCEQLFSAARSEFRQLEHFYFHNFPYESLWRESRLSQQEVMPTQELLRRHRCDYRVVLVGDAAMSPYEIVSPLAGEEGVESNWVQRLTEFFDRVIWLNPLPEDRWASTDSIGIISQLVNGHMYPMTPDGIADGTAYLSR